MKISLFLGAGASVPFGKPTTAQLKEKLINYNPQDLNEEILQSFLTNYKYTDIEFVLQAIRDIRIFSQSKGGMYFFEKGKNGVLRYTTAEMPFESFIKHIKEIEIMLENTIFDNYRWEQTSNKHLFSIYDEVFQFLKKYSEQICIFTTNYDRAIEQYCELRKDAYRCIDGFGRNPPDSEFAEWWGTFNDSITNDSRTNIFLYKLHGSLNWKEHVNGMLVRTNEEGKPNDSNYVKNILIYPTLSPKDEEETEPYGSIIERFREYMKITDVCIVIGYSFRDHLNNTFENFIKTGKTLVVISPTAIKDFHINLMNEKPDDAQLKKYENLLTEELSNTVFGATGGKTHLIQKKLDVNNIDEIIHDFKRILEPQKHPF